MKSMISLAVLLFAAIAARGVETASQSEGLSPGSWDARAAAAYLDGRQNWWLTWPNAARDHDTACVSCHTALPYALARPALRRALGEPDVVAPERKQLDNVIKRVRMWKDVDPFYPDQTRGLPKTSESRGTEAVLNAAILATYDASTGQLTSDTRQAFDNLWALQFKTGPLAGAWAWLNFKYEPWESVGAPYYGASLAALAVGTAPGGYASTPAIQERMKALSEYLQKGANTEYLFNRVMALWASSKIPSLLTHEQQRAIADALLAVQRDDGGWTMASLGAWKRTDGTPLETGSDGYATGLIAVVLQEAGDRSTHAAVKKALRWLEQHQDRSTGQWVAASLNKQRDPASDAGKFMSDAATAYASLALIQAR